MDSPSPRRYHRNSPNSSTSSTTNSNGGGHQLRPPAPSSVAAQGAPPPPARRSFGRSGARNVYLTTFVQADTNTFKQVVQMLTGCNETARLAASNVMAAATDAIADSSMSSPPHESGFKLYERRSNNLNLNLPTLPSNAGNNHGQHQEMVSPSMVGVPALVLSPVTPLIPDPFGPSSAAAGNYGVSVLNMEAGERAIGEKGFYFHPSPANTQRDTQPRLLPLFPTVSSRARPSPPPAGSSSSA